MNLKTKKQLAARVLDVGVERVMFDDARLNEIKESLTRQDIKDLVKNKAILLKVKSGRRKIKKRKTKKRMGKIKKKVNKRKQNYVILTRKLRKTIADLRKSGMITNEQYSELRKKIKAKSFKSRAHLMENVRK